MGDTGLILSFFLFVMASVASLGGLYLLKMGKQDVPPESLSLTGEPALGLRAQLAALLHQMGEALPNPFVGSKDLRKLLVAAGYRHPAAVNLFYGLKWASAVVLALVLGWVGLLSQDSPDMGLLLAVCGLGIGFMLPDRMLEGATRRRVNRLEAALPPALDLMVLSVEAGQPLDASLFETSRELRVVYPELAAELQQAQMELRAGRQRSEVLHDIGARTNSEELKKLSGVLIDADRFGVSLAPALRTHARYLRTRRRHQAQESARKLGVKLIFPVFFLIMPAVFVVTLGPAVIQIYQQVIPMVAGGR